MTDTSQTKILKPVLRKHGDLINKSSGLQRALATYICNDADNLDSAQCKASSTSGRIQLDEQEKAVPVIRS